MSANKIVVYTAIFGNYEDLIPQPEIPGVDYVCFSDTPRVSRRWQIRMVNPPCNDPTRCARQYKVLPHRRLGDYTISIWIDGNYLIVGDIKALIANALSHNNMAVFDHNQTRLDRRNCVYEEYEAIIRSNKTGGTYKDDPCTMKRQITRYTREGYPRQNGLIFSAVLLRRHNAPDVRRTMETWWREIETGSRRDQLSFDYAAWKEKLAFTVIDGDLRNNRWFYQIGIHRKSYRGKLFRYALKKRLGLIRHG
ncbi:MAG: DUF616 domain-containing protein [Chitinivibrionales bacterium]|nr:DUF616 domain-containing protein [Chitinivibrionales bacterium]MBD3357988.1 DUF616 domain-containing protein [Chitinivibrionales bacterium]